MPSLDERFESLGRLRSPDLWAEIQVREPRPSKPEPPPSRRWLAAAVALAVAVAGLAVVIRVFGTGADRRPATTSTMSPKANGVIYFRVGGMESGGWIDSISPDGSGRKTVFPYDPDGGVHFQRIAFSPDGTRIAFDYYLTERYGIYTSGPDGSDLVRLTDGVNDSWASWSPDGSRILFSSSRDTTQHRCTAGFPHEFGCPTDIYVMDADGSNVVRLTDGLAGEYMPVWSPDGTRIAFVREVGMAEAVFTMNPDGSDVRRVSSSSVGSDFWPSWSPDGTQIVFAAIRNENWGIWVVNADGSDEHLIVGGDGAWYADDPVWSPDGSLIAFVGNSTSGDYSPDDSLYVMKPDGSDLRLLADAPGYGVAGDIAWQPIPTEASPTAAPPSPPEPVPVAIRVSTIDGVAAFPSAVAVGEGGVWVTSCCGDSPGGDEVIRLDPTSGGVLARIGIRAAPGWEFGGAGLAVGDGSVWTVGAVRNDGGCCDVLVTRIDPTTNAVVDEITIPGMTEGDLWVEGSTVYVLGFTARESGSSSRLEVARVDADTHAIAWQVPVPGRWSQTVFVSGGWVWVVGTAPDARGPIEVTTLYRLDPGSGDIVDTISAPGTIGLVPVVYPDAVWFRTESGVQRFDPASGAFVSDQVRLQPGCCGGPFVSDGAGGVWVLSSAGAGVERSIWHVDASGVVVATGPIEDRSTFEETQGQSYAFDPEARTIWVQHYKDSVTRIELPSAS